MENNNYHEKNAEKEKIQKYIEKHNLEKVVSGMVNNLIKEKTSHPMIYMIKYLAGLMTEEEKEKERFIIPGPYPTRPQLPTSAVVSSKHKMLKKILDEKLLKELNKKTTIYGGKITDLLQPNEKYGIMLSDGDCMDSFEKLFIPMIEEIHKIKYEEHEYDFGSKNQLIIRNINSILLNIDYILPKISFLRIKWCRNIFEHPFEIMNNQDKLKSVADLLFHQISHLNDEKELVEKLKKYSMDENEDKCRAILESIRYNHKDKIKINKYIYSNHDNSIIILINFREHLQIILTTNNPKESFLDYYNKGLLILNKIEQEIQFEASKHVGYITSHLDYLGAGLEIYTETNLSQPVNDNILQEIFTKTNGTFTHKLKNNIIISKSTYKLNYPSIIDYLTAHFSQVSGYVMLNENINNKSFDTSIFEKSKLTPQTQDQYIKKAYDEVFTRYHFKVSSYGIPLNYIMRYYINDQLNPFGVIFHDENEYFMFEDFIQKYIYYSQNFDFSIKNHIHKVDDNRNIVIDEEDKDKIVYTSICLIRNIKGYPFPTSEFHKNEKVEQLILDTLNYLNYKKHYGDYYSLTDSSQKETANKLIEENQLMIFNRDDMKKFNMQTDFPKARGVIQFEKENTFAIVNDVEHIKFYLNVNSPCDSLSSQFVNILKIVNDFEKHLHFAYNKKYGFMTSCPRFLGTGLLLKMQLKVGTLERDDIDYVMRDKEFAWKIVKDVENKEYLIELFNKFTIGLSETELLTKLLSYINELFEVEKRGRKD